MSSKVDLGPRPRSLPIAPTALPSAKVRLPLADQVRPQDAVRPIYAVWEITLACDLACRHCGSRAGRERPDELSTAECLDLVNWTAGEQLRAALANYFHYYNNHRIHTSIGHSTPIDYEASTQTSTPT